MRTANLATGGVFLAIGAAWLAAGLELPLFEPTGRVGPGYLPLSLSIIVMVLALILAIRTLVSPEPEEDEKAVSFERVHRPIIALLLFAGTVALMERIGFILSMAFLIGGLMMGLEKGKLVVSIVVTIAVPVLSFIIFATFLGVRLPAIVFGN